LGVGLYYLNSKRQHKMAETDFINQVTTIEASWLNNIDEMVNGALGGTPTVPAVLAALGISGAAGLTLPLETALGGTGATSAAAGLAALGGTTLAAINQTYIGGQLYPAVSSESAVVVVQPWFPPGYVDRYEVNTSPGLTDMSTGLAAAFIVAQEAALLGQSGIPVRFGAGAYLINTPASIVPVPPNVMVPVDIGGVGLGTIIYCGLTGTGGLFSLTSGCHLHDMQIVSVAGTTNTGVIVETTMSTQPISWLIERVYSRMQGIGFLLSNCNSGVIRDCWHWLDNAPPLPIAITAAGANVGHGIYATGSFVNDVTVYDFKGACSVNYTSGQRWIKVDATNAVNFRIRGGLPVNESPGSSQKMLELGAAAGTSRIYSAEVTGVYHEAGFLEFNGCSFCNIQSCSNGGVVDVSGTGLNFANSSQGNYVGANTETGGTYTFDGASGGNVIAAGSFVAADSVNPTLAAPNLYLGANRSASFGGLIDNTLVYSASMTPNMVNGNYIRIVVTNATAFTINAPINPVLGMRATVLIYNNNAGAMGAVTWNAVFKMSAWTNPAGGFNRSIDFFYDGVHWVQTSQTGVDVPN
jgi:hypothetical protein